MSVFSLSIKAAMETLSAPLPDDLVLVGVALKSAPKIVRIEPFFFLLLFMLMADMALWVISRVIQAHLMAPPPPKDVELIQSLIIANKHFSATV